MASKKNSKTPRKGKLQQAIGKLNPSVKPGVAGTLKVVKRAVAEGQPPKVLSATVTPPKPEAPVTPKKKSPSPSPVQG
jgi:hypothetical protein